jgi:hypothetical protein
VTRCCEYSDEPSVFMIGREFINELSEYYFAKKNAAPWN